MYLRTSDYDPAIQDANLQQIISTNSLIRLTAENRAKEEIESYLKGKYDTDAEFTDTNPFDISATYYGASRIELNFSAYNPATSYLAVDNTCVTYGGYAYIILNDTTGTFNPSDWTLLGAQYNLLYVKNPYTRFDYYGFYNVGDIVFYKNKVYKCLQPSGQITHLVSLNAITINNIPPTNVFPDDTVYGLQVWGTGVDYQFTGLTPTATVSNWTAGTYNTGDRAKLNGVIYESLIDNNTVRPALTGDITSWQPETWVSGDNRSQRLVEIMVDITLMKVHQRIAPRNIPELREKNYHLALEWLKDSNHGNLTPNLLLLQPLQGNRISFGGNTKLSNVW